MLLSHRDFLIKEHVDVLKFADSYDICDPHTGVQIGIARDEPAPLARLLRPSLHRRFFRMGADGSLEV